MFILISALTANPTEAMPILRKDTVEEIVAVVERESRVDAITGKPEWVPTSQLAMFIHPSVVQDRGEFPIQEIPATTVEDWIAHYAEIAKAEWAQFMQIPTGLDRYTQPDESGINTEAVGTEQAAISAAVAVVVGQQGESPVTISIDSGAGDSTFALIEPTEFTEVPPTKRGESAFFAPVDELAFFKAEGESTAVASIIESLPETVTSVQVVRDSKKDPEDMGAE